MQETNNIDGYTEIQQFSRGWGMFFSSFFFKLAAQIQQVSSDQGGSVMEFVTGALRGGSMDGKRRPEMHGESCLIVIIIYFCAVSPSRRLLSTAPRSFHAGDE